MTDDAGPAGRGAWVRRWRAWTEAERLQRHEDKMLLVLTLLIGAAVGLVVVAFIVVTERLAAWLLPTGAAGWRRVAVPTAGALITGVLLARFFPNARGSGIPQTKTALFLHRGYIRLTTVLGKFACSALSLGSGIALGREGPTVQIGAGLASVLGRRLGLGPKRVQALLPIGTSAAVAAAFNTPISAVLFTLEEILGDLHAPVLGSVVIGSATSWAVLRLILGDEPLFHVPSYQLVHPAELGIYAALGVAGGLVSVAFVKLLLGLRAGFRRLPANSVPWQPAVGGLAIGLIGLAVPNVLGVGYNFVGDALNGRMVLSAMALLLVLKLVATATAYASGNAGGIFGPSLFIGAMLGGTLGGVAHAWLPDVTGSPGAYALVGMGTAFAGIVRAPMTSVIMIFEITRDYSIIVPVMIANLLSYLISQHLQPEPVYEALLQQDQISLPPPRMRESGPRVEQAMRTISPVLDAGDRVEGYLALVGAADQPDDHDAWPVLDGGVFIGMLTRRRLMAARQDASAATIGSLMPALDGPLTADRFPHVHPDQSMDVVLQRMGESGLTLLPVVSRTNVQDLLGVIALSDLPAAHRHQADDESSAEAAHQLERSSPRTLLIVVVAGVLGLFLVGGLLANHYYSARVQRAREAYESGIELVKQHRDADAVEAFRSALSQTHRDEYREALGLALARLGRDVEARVYLGQVLQREPSNGPANLSMARLQRRTGDVPGAINSYRRAASGTWNQEDPQDRTDGVFEFVALLRQTGAQREAEAELLREADRVTTIDGLVRVGQGLDALGSHRAAADVFKDVIARAPRSTAGYRGLGESLTAQDNLVAALDVFDQALRLDPEDSVAMHGRDWCRQVLSLDPTKKGLSPRERYERSQQVLQAVVAMAESCSGANTANGELASRLANARAAATSTKRPTNLAEGAESRAQTAESLWRVVSPSCTSQPQWSALGRVISRLQR